MVLGASPVLGDPLQVDPHVGGQVLALGQLLLGEQARLDPLGQLDLLLGVQQRHLADLLQVVLDRVRGRARDRHLRGRKMVVVIAEDEDLLVLAAAVRRDLDHPRGRRAESLGPGRRLAGLGVPGVFGTVRYFRPVDVVDGQLVGHLNDVADVVGENGEDGERGLEVGVVGVEIAKVVEIRVLQIRVGIEIRLVEIHHSQAAVDVGAQPRTAFSRVPGTRTAWPRSHLNRLLPDGAGALARGPGALPLALRHLPAVTLRAAPGFALPGITPAHPHRLLGHQPRQRHNWPRARPSPGPGHPGCLDMGCGSGNAELAGPGVRAGSGPFVVHPRAATGRDLAGPAISLAATWPSFSTRPGSHVTVHPTPSPAVGGIRTADQVISDRERHRSALRLYKPHNAHFAGEIHRIGLPGGRVLTDSPSSVVLADVLVIAAEDHGGDPGVPRLGQAGEPFPRGRAAVS